MRVAILSLFVLLFSNLKSYSAQPQNTQELKMLSMNFNAEADNPLLFQERLKIFEEQIIKKDLDLVMVQEGWQIGETPCFATQVAKDLDMDVAYHFEDGVSGIRVTSIIILAKKSLYLRNIQAFKLPHSAFTFGDGLTSWTGLGQVNMLLGGQITLANGQDAFIWTTHLYTDNSDYRVDQVKFIQEKMQNAVKQAGLDWNKALIFFTGDLNSLPDSPEMNYLKNSTGLKDSWEISHPDDPGHTFVSDINDDEYDPMTHGSGLFPSQYAPDHTARIDYIWSKIPLSYSVGTTRTFTAPIENIWMSDHYALYAHFILQDDTTQVVPSADSDMASLGKSVYYSVSDSDIDQLPQQMDFDVASSKGLTINNNTSYKLRFYFRDDNNAVYNSDSTLLEKTSYSATFAFFHNGDYRYRMVLTDQQNNFIAQMFGTVRVRF